MTTSAASLLRDVSESFAGNLSISSGAWEPDAAFDEGQFHFPTIDGGMMPCRAGASAVRDGAGIFIGGYFVGPTEGGFSPATACC